jgi:hypothetical protein
VLGFQLQLSILFDVVIELKSPSSRCSGIAYTIGYGAWDWGVGVAASVGMSGQIIFITRHAPRGNIRNKTKDKEPKAKNFRAAQGNCRYGWMSQTIRLMSWPFGLFTAINVMLILDD